MPPTRTEPQAALERRVATLEEENALLIIKLTKKHAVRSNVREGRVIRRLVCLTEPVTDLIAESDRRAMLAEGDSDDACDLVDSTDEENRVFRSYKKLLEWCTPVRGLMQGATDSYSLTAACQQLKLGADNARGDDANALKHRVAIWLNQQQPPAEPPIIPHSNTKADRGFNNDATGRLLCPVEYNWFDPTVRHAIKHYHSLYPVTAYSWPAFLYRNGQFDQTNPSHGLFKSSLLVRAFKCIFTSPTSALESPETQHDDPDDQHFNNRTGRKPRCNVAELLKMRVIQPRAIAYVAAQLRFALSSVSTWNVRDDVFDYQVFYDNIVDWFELPPTPARAREVELLLLWWNQIIFGRRRTHALQAQEINNLSVAMSMGLSVA